MLCVQSGGLFHFGSKELTVWIVLLLLLSPHITAESRFFLRELMHTLREKYQLLSGRCAHLTSQSSRGASSDLLLAFPLASDVSLASYLMMPLLQRRNGRAV